LTSQVLAPISHGIHRVTAHAHERGLNRAGATPNEWRRRAPAANPGLIQLAAAIWLHNSLLLDK